MDYIAQGFAQAVKLLVSGDPETYSAVFTTVKASSLSIAAVSYTHLTLPTSDLV